MNILNQPIGPGGAHAVAFPAGAAAKDGMPASLRFDVGPSTAHRAPRRQAQTLLRASSSSYVGAGHADEAALQSAAEQQKGAVVPPFQPVTLNFLRSLLDRESMTSIAEEGGEGAGVAAAAPPLHALRVVVSSAVALDARQTELIARKMRRITGFVNLAIENVVEPSLIAGFVVCYGLDDSHTIDLSVRGRLAALKNRVDSSDLDDRLHPRTPAPLH
ncbi:ATP synthase delta chain, chloroplastic [Triticum aestivum]|uniref:ATP synthase delta chain, chloroplastic n=1 Tax=Triticum aestivum TaxID=4565 RepID=A0A3B6HW06_WHEAT|nr:ATP synthase delta chain, chloroplastic-like [Triticum aestivum]